MSTAMPAAVAVEFGFGSPPDAASPTWTDVTAHVLVSDGITIEPGRTAERSSISPRRLAFTLDNRDGRFDPRNASGPYFGDLVPRVPVRVRVTYSAVTYTLFRGFVEGGWPQDFGEVSRKVPITAVDAAGWAAQCPPPRSAFEGEVGALREVEGATLRGWLRPQSDGTWVESMSGHLFPHSAKFEKLDPLVDGDEESGWGDVDGTGSAVDRSAVVQSPVFTLASPGLLAFWVRSGWRGPSGPGVDVFGVHQGQSAVVARLDIEFSPAGYFSVYANLSNSAGTLTVKVLDGHWTAGLLDGAPHFVALWSEGYGGASRLWVDGSEVRDLLIGSSGVGASPDNWMAVGRCRVETGEVPGDVGAHVLGALDHIQWWTDANSWGCTVDEAVTRLFEAGRLARVGDSMDARMSWLLDACGWSHVGTLDASQVTTQQGYRRRNTTLDLLQTIEDTEQGRIWVDNEGRWRFSARSWPTTDSRSNTVQATFGDTGSDLPYAAALSRIVDDDRAVVNVAEVTREYGTQQRSENAASIAAYGRRQTVTLSNLLHSNDRQSKAVADWLVAAHGEPQARVEVLTFHPANAPAALCPLAAQIEPGWLIRVKRDGRTFDAHVVDVGHRIGTTWEVSLHLDGTRATDLTGLTWDDGTGTVGTPWDDGTGTTTGAKGWVF